MDYGLDIVRDMIDWLEENGLSALLSLAALVVAGVTLRVSHQAFEAQQRQERRDFVSEIDKYAFWFSKELLNGNEVPPTDALSEQNWVLSRWATRLDQPGAEELCDWAMGFLNRLRSGSNDLRPMEEAMKIAYVGSCWAKAGSKESVTEAIQSEDPSHPS